MTLATACQRALVAGARREGAGTRQQLRAAARRFVRRHRRDSGYLRFVLRSVAASSALAVALLGLASAPARGFPALPFETRTDFDGLDVGSYSAPAFGDLDGDGDLDMVAGTYPTGTFRYFENDGGPVMPDPFERTGAANPLNGFDVGIWSIPALADLDADGDLDLLSGESSGMFFYFENTGTAKLPAFVQRTGAANPMNGVDVGSDSFPAFGDLDADGDLDLLVGVDDGTVRYYQNTGNAKTPAFVARVGSLNPMSLADVGQVATPSLADLDGDGDLDVLSGEAETGTIRLYENIGTAKAPSFVSQGPVITPSGTLATTALGDLDSDGDVDLVSGERYGTLREFVSPDGDFVARTNEGNPLFLVDIGIYSAPTLGDLDADGDLDVLTANVNGSIHYFRNEGTPTNPVLIEQTSFPANPLIAIDAGYYVIPFFADLDADGDLDLGAGQDDGTIRYFRNVGTPQSPSFGEEVGSANPFVSVDVGSHAAAAVGDLDADGDLDLIAAPQNGPFQYFENLGTSTSPGFVQRTGAGNPVIDIDTIGISNMTPALADVDGDGDLDLAFGLYGGGFRYYENTGSADSAKFAFQGGFSDPLTGEDVGEWATPALGDLDGDGDLDLISGEQSGHFVYFEGFVTQRPSVAAMTGSLNPLNGQDVGALAGPALADLDRDGDTDLLAGEDGGSLRYFENTGNALTPRFVVRTSSANPLNGRDVGDEAKPAFADLDGDGDFDLLSGSATGALWYFQNIGNAKMPAFAGPVVNPFGLSAVGASSAPVFGDVDGDGDLDLTVGVYLDTIQWFRNDGTRTAPAFVLQTGSSNRFSSLDVSYYTTPALADFDTDGDLDLVRGREHGRFFYHPNTLTAQFSRFATASPEGNPLDGEDVGEHAAPAAGDLNGDGTPDIVAGNLDGTFAVYFVPEPAQGAMLGAGIGLLGWFERLRRRKRATE